MLHSDRRSRQVACHEAEAERPDSPSVAAVRLVDPECERCHERELRRHLEGPLRTSLD